MLPSRYPGIELKAGVSQIPSEPKGGRVIEKLGSFLEIPMNLRTEALPYRGRGDGSARLESIRTVASPKNGEYQKNMNTRTGGRTVMEVRRDGDRKGKRAPAAPRARPPISLDGLSEVQSGQDADQVLAILDHDPPDAGGGRLGRRSMQPGPGSQGQNTGAHDVPHCGGTGEVPGFQRLQDYHCSIRLTKYTRSHRLQSSNRIQCLIGENGEALLMILVDSNKKFSKGRGQ